jgi:transposase
MAGLLVTDELWAIVEPLLPKHEPSPKGGHPRVPDRVCLTGIPFVLKTGLPWEDFPQEMGGGRSPTAGCSGMTPWNRPDEWRKAGVWDPLHRILPGKLRTEDKIDFTRVVVDSSSVRAVHGGKKRDQAPWTAGKRGPNTPWRSMPTEHPWPRRSPEPTGMT